LNNLLDGGGAVVALDNDGCGSRVVGNDDGAGAVGKVSEFVGSVDNGGDWLVLKVVAVGLACFALLIFWLLRGDMASHRLLMTRDMGWWTQLVVLGGAQNVMMETQSADVGN